MSAELTEEQTLNLIGFLKQQAATLRAGQDLKYLFELISYLETKLRSKITNEAWEKYQREKGLLPQVEESRTTEEVKEV